MTKLLHIPYGLDAEQGFTLRTAMAEASRCLLCHDAPCSAACPASTDPGKFIRSLRFANIKGAAETIRENNPLAGSCARVCPYDVLCEGACSRTGIDKPIQIGKLQRFLVEQEQQHAMRIMHPGSPVPWKTACIGAGPASLACAAVLAQKGCSTTVFEAKPKAGGILSYGITPSRLPRSVVDYDVARIADLGVSFEFNKKITLQEVDGLRREYDAVFVGAGLGQSMALNIPGAHLQGVYSALEYLENAATAADIGGADKGKAVQVLVIGGGDVAMDCAVTAKQLGGDKTCIVYRRTMGEAPAHRAEMDFVHSMGIPLLTDFAPAEILGENGKVSGMRFTGRDGESALTLKADSVVFAIGQKQEESFAALQAEGNLFIGGDYANGGKTVVQAVAEGKAAAESIWDYLQHKQ